jgi:mono/diheme cytochrome c family protein
VTEIPEHLLKRSQERRAAIGGEAAPAADPTPSGEAVEPAAAPDAAAPAVPAAAAAAEVAPPPPAPVRPEVAAAQQRHKIPFWALSVLVFLPLWAYVYQGTLEPPPAGESDPLVLGEHVYGGCAACHGAGGGGGTGPALTGVLETWPDFRDHLAWVRLGSTGWPGNTYGANGKPKAGGMPGHAALSDEELAQVVLYERVTFGGLDPNSEEYAELAEMADGHSTVADGGLGEESQAAGVDEASLGSG